MKFIVSLIFTIALCSCSVNKKYDHLMDHADSIMNINDDSAAIVIKQFDSIKSELSNFSKSQRMRYALLYHKAMNKADITFTSDSIMKEVVNYYKHHGTNNNRMLAYYIMGCVYRDLEEAPMALEYYNKAVEQADTTAKDCDYATLCRVYSQMGILFHLQYFAKEELKSLNLASKYAFLAKDTLNAITYYQNSCFAYETLNNIDSVISINKKASKMYNEHGYPYQAKIAYGCNYPFYLKRNCIKQAMEAFYIYKSTGYKGNSNYGKDTEANLLCGEGELYLKINKLDSAYICLAKAYALSESYSNKRAITNNLSEYFKRNHNYEMAMQYAQLSSLYNDSCFIELRNAQLQQTMSLYNYNRNKNIVRTAEQKAYKRTIIMYFIMAASFILIISLYFLFKKRLMEKKQKLIIIKKIYNDTIQDLELAKEELLKIQKHDDTITALIKEKEDAIIKLQKEVKKYEDANINHSLLLLDKKLQDTLIYKRLVYIERHPQEKMSAKDWRILEETIENNVYAFASLKQKLKKNPKDYRICLLIKMNFNPSSISHILETSLSDISLSRQRMLYKVCGKVGKAKDFDEYVRQLL